MKATVNPEVENAIADIARRHGLSREAVLSMLFAMHVGGGTMAQFSIPELGGSGQWMQGGMTMVGGNMFDNALKARVDGRTLVDLFDTEDWWRAFRTDTVTTKVVVGDAVLVNRGVELSGDAIDSSQALIGSQVKSGVAVRMAVLYELLVGAPQLQAVA